MDKVCRCCLAADATDVAHNADYQEFYQLITNVPFQDDSGKPTSLCYECLYLFRKCMQLRDKSLKADRMLAKLIANGVGITLKSILNIDKIEHCLTSKCVITHVYSYELGTNDNFNIKIENDNDEVSENNGETHDYSKTKYEETNSDAGSNNCDDTQLTDSVGISPKSILTVNSSGHLCTSNCSNSDACAYELGTELHSEVDIKIENDDNEETKYVEDSNKTKNCEEDPSDSGDIDCTDGQEKVDNLNSEESKGGGSSDNDKLAMTHRERHCPCQQDIPGPVEELTRLRRDIVHEPKYTSGNKYRKRCVVCLLLKDRQMVHSECVTCGVFLCFGNCWKKWHTSKKLEGQEGRGRKRRRHE